jgi:hypothetical protein
LPRGAYGRAAKLRVSRLTHSLIIGCKNDTVGQRNREMAYQIVEQYRERIRAMDFAARSPAEVAQWHENDLQSVANNEIEGITSDPLSDAFFSMLKEEAVPTYIAASLLKDFHSSAQLAHQVA